MLELDCTMARSQQPGSIIQQMLSQKPKKSESALFEEVFAPDFKVFFFKDQMKLFQFASSTQNRSTKETERTKLLLAIMIRAHH